MSSQKKNFKLYFVFFLLVLPPQCFVPYWDWWNKIKGKGGLNILEYLSNLYFMLYFSYFLIWQETRTHASAHTILYHCSLEQHPRTTSCSICFHQRTEFMVIYCQMSTARSTIEDVSSEGYEIEGRRI